MPGAVPIISILRAHQRDAAVRAPPRRRGACPGRRGEPWAREGLQRRGRQGDLAACRPGHCGSARPAGHGSRNPPAGRCASRARHGMSARASRITSSTSCWVTEAVARRGTGGLGPSSCARYSLPASVTVAAHTAAAPLRGARRARKRPVPRRLRAAPADGRRPARRGQDGARRGCRAPCRLDAEGGRPGPGPACLRARRVSGRTARLARAAPRRPPEYEPRNRVGAELPAGL
jgi:hypothetical protein